jgi:hypothetical protein
MAHGSLMGKQKVLQGYRIVVSTVGNESLGSCVGPSVGARVSPEISSTVGSSVVSGWSDGRSLSLFVRLSPVRDSSSWSDGRG